MKEIIEIVKTPKGYKVYHSKVTSLSAYGETVDKAFKEFGIIFALYLTSLEKERLAEQLEFADRHTE